MIKKKKGEQDAKETNINKVLLIPNFGMGDILIAIPLLKKIKTILPQIYQTIVVVGKRNYHIARYCDWINDYIYIDDVNVLLKDHSLSLKWMKILKKKVSENDLIICLIDIPFFNDVLKNVKSNKLLFWRNHYLDTNEKIYEGFHRMINTYFGWEKSWLTNIIPTFKKKHIEFLNIWIDKNQLHDINTACLVLKSRTSGEVCIKDIPLFTAQLIVDFFISKGYKPCIIVPPDSNEEFYYPLLRRKDIIVISLSDIMKVLILIKAMDIVIGPDTGLMHYASLADKRVISLFSHSSKIFYPTGRNVIVIDKGIDCQNKYNNSENCLKHSTNCLSTLRKKELNAAFYQININDTVEKKNESGKKNLTLKNVPLLITPQFDDNILYKY